MHGGRSNGPKTAKGKGHARRAVTKHGEYTKEARARHKKVMELIKTSKDVLDRL